MRVRSLREKHGNGFGRNARGHVWFHNQRQKCRDLYIVEVYLFKLACTVKAAASVPVQILKILHMKINLKLNFQAYAFPSPLALKIPADQNPPTLPP